MMKIIKNKKGLDQSTLKLLGGIIVMIIVVVIVYSLVSKATRFGLAGVKALETPTIKSEEFSFYADKINITADSGCIFDTVKNIYMCPKDQYINFTTTMRNEYNRQLQLYGGFIFCNVKCNDKEQCTITNKKCLEENIVTSAKFCYLSIAETRDCDGWKKSFEVGEYFIYPLAKCDDDKTMGCWVEGMTKEVMDSSSTYIRMTITN